MPTNFMSIILILGLKACLELNLISRLYSLNLKSKTATSEEILDSYSDVLKDWVVYQQRSIKFVWINLL